MARDRAPLTPRPSPFSRRARKRSVAASPPTLARGGSTDEHLTEIANNFPARPMQAAAQLQWVGSSAERERLGSWGVASGASPRGARVRCVRRRRTVFGRRHGGCSPLHRYLTNFDKAAAADGWLSAHSVLIGHGEALR
jgi:hypothetical protein